jgi:hypothetical protein
MMIKIYNIRIHPDLTENNALCISATMHVFVYVFRKGNILSQMQWKGL